MTLLIVGEDIIGLDYPPPLGHRRTKLYWCDNCGRRHWGHYEKVGGWEFTEYDFVWTTPQGVRKERSPC